MKTVRTVAENWGFTIEYTKKVLEVFGVRVTDPDYIFNEEEIRRINDGVIRTHIAGNGMTVSELESQKKQDEQERIRQQMFRLEQERIAREQEKKQFLATQEEALERRKEFDAAIADMDDNGFADKAYDEDDEGPLEETTIVDLRSENVKCF